MSGLEPAPPALALGYRAVGTEDANEIGILPDLGEGLSRYAGRARQLGEQLVRTGPARGIVTFARPLSSTDLAALERLGLGILTIEAVSEEIQPDVRLTYSNAYGSSVWRQMELAADAAGTKMLGVVAAEVTVSSLTVYESLVGHEAVYLIDLSPEQVRRSSSGSTDVNLNDLYWYLAGWIVE